MKELKFGGHAAAVESKPDDLVDACWSPDGRKIVEEQTYYGPTECNRLYPSYSTPRMVAGGPLSSDIIACRLKQPDIADYPQHHVGAVQETAADLSERRVRLVTCRTLSAAARRCLAVLLIRSSPCRVVQRLITVA